MKEIHTPKVGMFYWGVLTLASIFGTNLGDFYAHKSGLGIAGGLLILAVLFWLVRYLEQFDVASHHYYYWTAIIIIRTGATNIADFLAGRNGMHLDRVQLSSILALLMAGMAWNSQRSTMAVRRNENIDPAGKIPAPGTTDVFWFTMLLAGIFGTVFGDFCSHSLGGGMAAVTLLGALILALFRNFRESRATILYYWFVVAVARSAGTAVGDWIAENHLLNLGITVSTICTGALFVLALFVWRMLQEKRQLNVAV